MASSRFAAQAARSAAFRAPMAWRVPVRTYAQAAPSASTKPPVPLFGVDGTYASALYTAAAKTSAIEPIGQAMDRILAVFKKDAKLQEVMQAPMLSESDKKQIVQTIMQSSGAQDKGDVLKNFLETLVENNRLAILEPVCEKFGTLMSAYRGEVELVVTSAAPLEQRVLRQLEAAVSKSQYLGQGKKLKVVPKVNPDIRGGLIVEIGDRTIDLSVSAKMAKMNKLLRDQL